jgi:cytoskeletal protein RodZ
LNRVDELRKLRKLISLDLKTISEKTKIPTFLLKKIELKQFNKLPPFPIGPSFISQYFHQIELASSDIK